MKRLISLICLLLFCEMATGQSYRISRKNDSMLESDASMPMVASESALCFNDAVFPQNESLSLTGTGDRVRHSGKATIGYLHFRENSSGIHYFSLTALFPQTLPMRFHTVFGRETWGAMDV